MTYRDTAEKLATLRGQIAELATEDARRTGYGGTGTCA